MVKIHIMLYLRRISLVKILPRNSSTCVALSCSFWYLKILLSLIYFSYTLALPSFYGLHLAGGIQIDVRDVRMTRILC